MNTSRKVAIGVIVLLSSYFFWIASSKVGKRPKVKPRPVAVAPSKLGSDERSNIEVFEKSSSSVVYISNTHLKRELFSLNVFEIPQGAGSGFVWDENGHVVTNFHVIYGANKIEVILNNGSHYKAKVVGVAPDYDLAVLRVSALKDKILPLSIGLSKDLKVGQKVMAIGNPFGLDQSLTTGIVSALGRSIKSLTGVLIHDVIQTDAAINPGNSGGPLLDSFGRVIGVNLAIISPSGANAGVGFAVPVDTVNRIVPELISRGKIAKAGLGVALLPENIKQRLGIKGVVIYQVARGGPANKAGLRGTKRDVLGRIELGDIIKSIDDKEVEDNDKVLDIISNKKIGQEIELEISRRGEEIRVKLMLEEI